MTQIQVRRDTAANWASSNPTLGGGEPGYDSDSDATKWGDGATAWNSLPWAITQPFYTPPPTTGWSTTSLGSATFAADKGGRLLTMPTNTGNAFRVEYRTLSPTSNYTFTACLEASLSAASQASGIILRNSSSGSMIYFGPIYSGTLYGLESWKLTSATTYSTQYGTSKKASDGTLRAIPDWVRFRDDGSLRYLEYSYNGLDWLLHFSVSRTDFITPDQVGWMGNNNGSGATGYVRLRSWSVA